MRTLKLPSIALIATVILCSPTVRAEPFDVLRNFNALIFQNFTSQYSDVEGTLAVGGNTTLYNYSINQSNAPFNGYGLIVGGNLTFSNGTVWNSGRTYFGGALNSWAVDYTGGTFTVPNTNPVDFGALRSSAIGASSDYAALTANGSVSYVTPDLGNPAGSGNARGLRLTGDGTSALQVFNIDGDLLGGRNEISLGNIPSFASIVLNVSGINTGLHNLDSSSPFDPWAGRVVFNFFQATTVTFDHTAPHASILAPFATIESSQFGHIAGTVVANEWNGAFQLNVVAVPEPEIYMMLVVGFGAIGCLSRRRRQRPAATM